MALPTTPQLKDYIFTDRIGSGSYATVYKAFRKSEKREVVAIKCVEISSLSKPAIDNLLTEISLLKKLKHEYIVEMIDFQWNSKYIFIIMEYCSGGDLSSFIRSRRSLPENVVKLFLQQLAKALQFLRNENICHMDLKPQNILLTSRQNPVLKLGDFGFAQHLKPQDDCSSLRGSPLYMAPEILLQHKYDARVDLWSVGVILYESLFGRAPYSSRTFAELVEKIKDPSPIEIPYGVKISCNCRDLLMRLLKRDPEERITYEEFFAHPFLDLEHMPSPTCYAKAVDILADAVTHDEDKDYMSAVHLYCSGLQYLIAAVQYERDLEKKEAMRHKAKQYMARAEHLKQILKSEESHSVINLSAQSPFEELYEMSSDSVALRAALTVGNAAEELDRKEKFETALEKYLLALDSLLPILQEETISRRRDLLSNQIRTWMTRAENIKCILSLGSLPSETSEYTKDDQTRQLNCVLQ